jgi:hypothetical protein
MFHKRKENSVNIFRLLTVLATNIFFLEHAGELYIIILLRRRGVLETRTKPTH